MADFALWATACETAFWPPGTFGAAYGGNRDDAVDSVIEADPVGSAIRSMMSNKAWQGTATQLLAALDNVVEEKIRNMKDWLKNARTLSGRVRRVAPLLRKVGIEIEHAKEGHARTRIIHITNVR